MISDLFTVSAIPLDIVALLFGVIWVIIHFKHHRPTAFVERIYNHEDDTCGLEATVYNPKLQPIRILDVYSEGVDIKTDFKKRYFYVLPNSAKTIFWADIPDDLVFGCVKLLRICFYDDMPSYHMILDVSPKGGNKANQRQRHR